jgi:hypothetical protein
MKNILFVFLLIFVSNSNPLADMGFCVGSYLYGSASMTMAEAANHMAGAARSNGYIPLYYEPYGTNEAMTLYYASCSDPELCDALDNLLSNSSDLVSMPDKDELCPDQVDTTYECYEYEGYVKDDASGEYIKALKTVIKVTVDGEEIERINGYNSGKDQNGNWEGGCEENTVDDEPLENNSCNSYEKLIDGSPQTYSFYQGQEYEGSCEENGFEEGQVPDWHIPDYDPNAPFDPNNPDNVDPSDPLDPDDPVDTNTSIDPSDPTYNPQLNKINNSLENIHERIKGSNELLSGIKNSLGVLNSSVDTSSLPVEVVDTNYSTPSSSELGAFSDSSSFSDSVGSSDSLKGYKKEKDSLMLDTIIGLIDSITETNSSFIDSVNSRFDLSIYDEQSNCNDEWFQFQIEVFGVSHTVDFSLCQYDIRSIFRPIFLLIASWTVGLWWYKALQEFFV